MPMLNEQSVMYMPVTPYGISVDQSKTLTQKTDAIIKSFPEVATVFGKGGRANSATDPAPLGMIETIITFKPQAHIHCIWGSSLFKIQIKEIGDIARIKEFTGNIIKSCIIF